MYREMKKEELMKSHLKKKLEKKPNLKEGGENFKERLLEATKI